MKKVFTLVAAVLMAVGASAGNKVLKITGTAAKTNDWDISCFINLKNVEKGKADVVKFDIYTSSKTEFTIGTEAIDDKQTEHQTQYSSSAVFNYTEGVTVTNTPQEAVLHFPGKTTIFCNKHKTDEGDEKIENFEYAATALLLNVGKLPVGESIFIDNVRVYDAEGNLLSTEDFEDATVAAYDNTKTVYYPGWQNAAKYEIVNPALSERYNLTLTDLDFSKEGTSAIGGWGGNFKSEIVDGVDVLTFTKGTNFWDVQANLPGVYPKGATIKLTMEAKGSVEGEIPVGLQNPNGYQGRGDFEKIALTTDYQTFERTVTCSGDNAQRLLFSLGTYDGTVSIKSLKIEALDVPQEGVTIPANSSYATYAAYYPVDYSAQGLKAYAVKVNEDKQTITLNEINGVVPAGVAVLLQGEAEKEYAFENASGWQNISTDLKASDGTITSTDTKKVYGLATVDNQDGFWLAKDDAKIPAQCGYLEVAATANQAAYYSLGDHSGNTTAISDIKAETVKADGQMYNLAGQAVGKGYKGIVIKNGKKMIVK